MTGFKNWYIKRLGRDTNHWPYWVFVRVGLNGDPEYVPDQFQATPFKLRDNAEKAAFDFTIRDPDLIQKLKVELL